MCVILFSSYTYFRYCPHIHFLDRTLARVTHEYPVDEVVQKFAGVNFGTVHFSWFEMLGIIYHASSTSAPAAA